HARKMRRTACAGDDHLEPALARARGVVVEALRGAVRRDDAGLVRHAQSLEHVSRGLQRRPVGLAAHDDADAGLLIAHVRLIAEGAPGLREKRGIYRVARVLARRLGLEWSTRLAENGSVSAFGVLRHDEALSPGRRPRIGAGGAKLRRQSGCN